MGRNQEILSDSSQIKKKSFFQEVDIADGGKCQTLEVGHKI